MARAKQTGRSEARRRYRQTTAPIEGDDGELLEPGDDTEPERPTAKATPRATDSRPPSGRLGFGASFRLAYHPPNVREDLRTLPTTLRSRGFIAAILMVVVAGALWYVYPYYSGSLQAWDLIVRPGSALAPQLVAGFFAPRASYLLGILIGVLQPIVFLLVTFSPRVQEVQARYVNADGTVPGVPVDQVAVVFFNSVLMGGLFAAMAAWYRRFLALSSQRSSSASRAAAASRSSSKTPAKPSSRRTASR